MQHYLVHVGRAVCADVDTTTIESNATIAMQQGKVPKVGEGWKTLV